MAIHYHCRHCGTKIGKIDKTLISTQNLGLDSLTEQERLEMVSYDAAGDVYITSICEDCQEALDRNPDYHQLDYFIQ